MKSKPNARPATFTELLKKFDKAQKRKAKKK